MLKKNPVAEKIFGLLLMCLGGSFAYPEWGRLRNYVQTGYIVFDPRRGAPLYGTEAAFWHVAYLLLGLLAVAYGISLVIRRD